MVTLTTLKAALKYGTTQKSHVTTRKGQRDVVVHNRKGLQQTALEKL